MVYVSQQYTELCTLFIYLIYGLRFTESGLLLKVTTDTIKPTTL